MSMQIRKINTTTRATNNIVALSSLGSTRAQAIDVSSNGTLYVADFTRDVILKVFENGAVNGAVLGHLNTAGNVNSNGITTTGNDARLASPLSICVDKSNNVFIGDGSGGFQVRRMSPSGVVSFLAGNGSFGGDAVNLIDGDNDGTKARFNPSSNGMGLAVDAAGVLYLADTGNNKVKKIWSSGKTTSMAGVNVGGFVNGVGGAAQFNSPYDVCVDAHARLFVCDRVNNRIRKITESGIVTTLAGLGTGSFVDGNGATATFNSPVRICMDPSNNFVYVMDHGNAAIRKVDMTGNVTTFCHFNVPPTGEGDICVDKSGFLYILENNS